MLIDLEAPLPYYYFVLACLVVAFAFLAILYAPLRSRAGRHPRERAAHAGHRYSTYLYKLAAFVISGMLAGVAGFFSWSRRLCQPELLGWHLPARC